MTYPKDLLGSRAVIEPGKFALIPPEGLVNNVIPGFKNCITSIVASPKYGASFVQYLVTVKPNGCSTKDYGTDPRIETFLYCLDGNITVSIEDSVFNLTSGGYVYCRPEDELVFENISDTDVRILLYKQIYIPLEGHKPWNCTGNTNELTPRIYDDMDNVTIVDLLPTDICFDLNMHILTFKPGGCHPFVETHVQEHGAYLLSGEGVYYLGNEWIPVKKNDYIWFGPYVPQGVYCAGRENLSYIYSKDCNRDVLL
ncbi:MAG: (S)-ureidoglycine aminohydrolase [Clostridiaceae bacterium]